MVFQQHCNSVTVAIELYTDWIWKFHDIRSFVASFHLLWLNFQLIHCSLYTVQTYIHSHHRIHSIHRSILEMIWFAVNTMAMVHWSETHTHIHINIVRMEYICMQFINNNCFGRMVGLNVLYTTFRLAVHVRDKHIETNRLFIESVLLCSL